jgi:hypothetical protein
MFGLLHGRVLERPSTGATMTDMEHYDSVLAEADAWLAFDSEYAEAEYGNARAVVSDDDGVSRVEVEVGEMRVRSLVVVDGDAVITQRYGRENGR